MSRAVAKSASQLAEAGKGFGRTGEVRAGDIYSSIGPQLKNMAANPQGYSPEDINAMTTASNQALGGATAGVTGQAALQTARTRNAGGYSSALDSAARGAEQEQSQNALAIQGANADVKQQQQQSALGMLGNLYGTNVGATLGGYGASNAALGTQLGASPGWFQNMTSLISALGGGKGIRQGLSRGGGGND